MSLLFVLLLVSVLFIFHIILHRFFACRSRFTFTVTVVYGLGFPVLYWARQVGILSMPSASTVLYIFLSLLVIFFYLTPFLGGETPASMMLDSFKKTREQAFEGLVGIFTNTGLIWKRIEDLQMAGLIKKTGGKYSVTGRGAIVAQFVLLYQKLFHRNIVG